MSLINESERSELLEFLDGFYMAKLMRNEGIEMENIRHGQVHPSVIITTCLLYLKEKYPYFEFRHPKPGKDDAMFRFRISLPRSLKSEYKSLNIAMERMFNNAECFYGEISCKRHYNELHVESYACSSFHNLLEDMIHKFKELKKKEESIA